MGSVTQYDPSSTDADSFAQDWLWRKSARPQFGGPLDATALDLAETWDIDLKGRPTLRVLEKNHGLQLCHLAGTTSLININVHLRILVLIL